MDTYATDLGIAEEDGRVVLTPVGDWLVDTVASVDAQIRTIEAKVEPGAVVIDFSRLARIDTAGAYVLEKPLRRCGEPDGDFHFRGEHATARALLRLARENATPCPPPPKPRPTAIDLLDRAGRGLVGGGKETLATVSFLGELLSVAGRSLFHPDRVRWRAVVAVMESAGVNAVPIVATLTFFVGAVLAYLGASLLETFGASVFTVELVGFGMLREFGVVITAILLAGRSDSAFTAQIGAMRMNQEIDAMRVIGLDPYEVLVLPRVLACLIMTPILSFIAMMSGLLGGGLVAWGVLGLSPGFFVTRLSEAIPIVNFWAGMAKAPVFAVVIAVIGCRQGLLVGGDVESLGRRVTAAVVQALFAIIVIDALFAMAYLQMGI